MWMFEVIYGLLALVFCGWALGLFLQPSQGLVEAGKSSTEEGGGGGGASPQDPSHGPSSPFCPSPGPLVLWLLV